MLIVLALYGLVVWLVFSKFQWLEYTKLWRNIVWGGAITIAFVVVGALQFYTPVSTKAVVQAVAQNIYPQISGQVKEIYIQGSQPVKAGDKLYLIDPRPFQYAVDNWTAAERLAGIAYRDAEKLMKTGAISRIAFDRRQAEYDQSRAQLANARFNLENTLVTAPADGLITVNTLKAGQQVSPSQVTLTFLDTGSISIIAIMKQNGLSGIKAGKSVSVTFNAAPGEIYHTTVLRQVDGVIQGQLTVESASSPLEVINKAQNSYPVKIVFPEGAPEALKAPGNLASVTVFTDEGNPINVLAKILLWINTWMNYIF